MRFVSFPPPWAALGAVFLCGCAHLLPEHRYALNSLQIREHVIALDEDGRLACASSEVFIDSRGRWTGKNYAQDGGADCLKEPLFAYTSGDRAKLEAFIEEWASAYYKE